VAALDAARAVFRTEIEAHHGRVVYMAGDSVLALFETAAGAVNAALAIQASIDAQTNAVPAERRLRFRIGVHLGDVIGKADGTVYGNGVNIAVRLQALAEPGGINVSESIRSAVKGKVKALFTDLGEQSVKNIADSVRAHAAVSTEATLVAATGVDISAPVAGFGGRPAIAVLPFADLWGDAEQEYFAYGLAEDILTRLALWRWLPVIARNSSFSFKGHGVDVKAVGRALGPRYVLEGNLHRSGNRVRVTGQLIDAETGHHLWAERFDRVLEDLQPLTLDRRNQRHVGQLHARRRNKPFQVAPYITAVAMISAASWRRCRVKPSIAMSSPWRASTCCAKGRNSASSMRTCSLKRFTSSCSSAQSSPGR
jgi:adenylate cyclase